MFGSKRQSRTLIKSFQIRTGHRKQRDKGARGRLCASRPPLLDPGQCRAVPPTCTARTALPSPNELWAWSPVPRVPRSPAALAAAALAQGCGPDPGPDLAPEAATEYLASLLLSHCSNVSIVSGNARRYSIAF